jgi:hypothetical protein
MAKKNEGFGIASFVLGIVSIVLAWTFYIGLPCGIVGIVLAVKQRSSGQTKLGNAGFILSIIGTVLSVLVLLFVILIIGSALFVTGSILSAFAGG